ncbi:MAG TPA: hypothetical protein EYP25_04455 [Anaerolineae bacterium]|nr:hypothetical protein [Caldilineae bacterium]HID33810.1 hypothetical protein [Anaerolineae bacterium]
MPPAAAMRVDGSRMLTKGRRTLLERWFLPPLWLRLPLRDVIRNRRRTLTTVVGGAFSFMMTLIGLGMLDSMNYILDRNFRDVETWDALVFFNAPQTPAALQRVAVITGVKQAEPVIQIPATLQAHGREADAFIIAIQAEGSMHVLQLPAGVSSQTVLTDGYMALSPYLVETLGLAPGDKVNDSSFLGETAFIYETTTDELGGSLAYIANEEAQRQIGAPMDVFNSLWLITLLPGLFLGWMGNAWIISTFNTEMIHLAPYIIPASFVWTSLGIWVIMLLSTLPAIRHINRLNLAEATKMIT